MTKNKKGGLLDLIVFIALGFLMVVVLVIFLFAGNTVNTALLDNVDAIEAASPSVNGTELINDTVGKVVSSYEMFKWISILLLFGFALSILISSFLVKTHPAWLYGYALIVVISIIISVYVSNAYESLLSNGLLGSTFYQFVGANFIFLHLPIWITIVGMIAGILMYINLSWGDYYR